MPILPIILQQPYLPFYHPIEKKLGFFASVFTVRLKWVKDALDICYYSPCVCFPFWYVLACVFSVVVFEEEFAEGFNCCVLSYEGFFVEVDCGSAGFRYEAVEVVA